MVPVVIGALRPVTPKLEEGSNRSQEQRQSFLSRRVSFSITQVNLEFMLEVFTFLAVAH